MKSDYQKLALSILRHLKIPYKIVPRFFKPQNATRDYMWDGSCLYLFKNNSFSNTIHELAHWLYATEAQRKLPEYGLGQPPERIKMKVRTTLKTAWEIEHNVSSLGIAIEKCLRFPSWRNSAKIQEWSLDEATTYEDANIYKFWDRHKTHNLYSSEGVPKIIDELQDWLKTNRHYKRIHSKHT